MAGGLPHPVLWSHLTGLDHAVAEMLGNPNMETKHIVYSWLAMVILIVFSYFARKKLTLVPGKVQNVAEVVVGGLEDFVVSVVGEDGRKIYPILCGIFLYILVQNILGLVPGCDAPTANINTNAAMALFAFAYYNLVGLWRWKFGYIKHFMGPMWWLSPLMLPIEFISHLARPLSLTLRLFGNIRGEEIVLVLFFMLAPIVGTVPIYFLFMIAKVLQAFIFFMLTMIYLKGSLEHAH